jgi:hypothetical protein
VFGLAPWDQPKLTVVEFLRRKARIDKTVTDSGGKPDA